MMDKNTRRPEIHLTLASLALVSGLFGLTLIFDAEPFRGWFIGEGGLVETLSALGYLLVIGGMVFWGGGRFLEQHIPLAVILLVFSAREFDFDKRFTDMGILKSRFYISADIPMMQKLVAGLIILAILAAIGMAVKRYSHSFIGGLRAGRAGSRAIALGIVILGISKGVLDGFPRKIADFGFEVPARAQRRLGDFEECLELAIPLLFLVGLWGYFRHARRSDGATSSHGAK